MIALDTNILVYAHRRDSEWHEPASRTVKTLAEGRGQWAIPWPCIHEFLAITTHPRIFDPPTPLRAAIDQIEAWMNSSGLVLLSESHDYWGSLTRNLKQGHIAGPQVHDARVAAICENHGVAELWTADRDFSRFPTIKTRNPLITPAP